MKQVEDSLIFSLSVSSIHLKSERPFKIIYFFVIAFSVARKEDSE